MNYFPASKEYPNSTWHLSDPNNILNWVKSLPIVSIRRGYHEDNPNYEVNILKERARQQSAKHRAKKLASMSLAEKEAAAELNRKKAKVYYRKNRDKILEQKRKHYEQITSPE